VLSAHELQDLFNRNAYMQRAIDDGYSCCLKREKRAVSPSEPPGTRSLTISYLDRHGQRVFTVHIYLRPNGEIGASGLADPKWLRHDDTIYTCDRPRQNRLLPDPK
jgi:hypothetical protein